jgi:ribosomal protein S18 acetylase RimI-like enzyme
MHIEEVTANTSGLTEAINRFLHQLTSKEQPITESDLAALVASENSHLFVAVDQQGRYAGMITVGIYRAPTGKKAWIEDVVVDEAYRGQGVGKQLTLHAIAFARQQQVSLLSLTSNPARIAANQLYPNVGFLRKETNVYVMRFD